MTFDIYFGIGLKVGILVSIFTMGWYFIYLGCIAIAFVKDKDTRFPNWMENLFENYLDCCYDHVGVSGNCLLGFLVALTSVALWPLAIMIFITMIILFSLRFVYRISKKFKKIANGNIEQEKVDLNIKKEL